MSAVGRRQNLRTFSLDHERYVIVPSRLEVFPVARPFRALLAYALMVLSNVFHSEEAHSLFGIKQILRVL